METVLYKRHPEFSIYFISNDGQVFNVKRGKFIAQFLKNGYWACAIHRKFKLTHRLLMATHIGASHLMVNHKDGDKANCKIENLEYVTPLENVRHSIEVLGNSMAMEKNPKAKLKNSDILDIKKMRGSGMKHREIAEKYGVCTATISHIFSGINWRSRKVWASPVK